MPREIGLEIFDQKFREQLIYANFNIRSDIREYFNALSNKSNKDLEKKVVEVFVQNAELASVENRAVCQDSGYVQVYLTIGNKVILNFVPDEEINRIVQEVYESNHLRKSIADPIIRSNTRTNTPVMIHYDIVAGDELKVQLLIKGGGSENVTRAGFLLPTSKEDKIIDWVVESVRIADAKACPPYILGVGIGGTLEKAVHYSKRLLLENLQYQSKEEDERYLSGAIIEKVNSLNIGFQGLHFGKTAIGVFVKKIACHIATLPIAVSIGCNAVRQGEFII